jgi:uncharacterized protein YjlB
MKAQNTASDKNIQKVKISFEVLNDDGTFPNNKNLPLIIYKEALILPAEDAASVIEKILHENSWENTWRNGVYGFHHYHSTAHEVLVVYSGQAEILLGGENGLHVEIKKGDVLIIPAGVAHKNILSDSDFKVIGGYPKGQDWDMNYGKKGERLQADSNIARVPLPVSDPIYGKNGPIFDYWG